MLLDGSSLDALCVFLPAPTTLPSAASQQWQRGPTSPVQPQYASNRHTRGSRAATAWTSVSTSADLSFFSTRVIRPEEWEARRENGVEVRLWPFQACPALQVGVW